MTQPHVSVFIKTDSHYRVNREKVRTAIFDVLFQKRVKGKVEVSIAIVGNRQMKKLNELDSAVIRDRLLRIFSTSQIPHAFLFSGPKGTGKTSAARIIAKVLNCEKRNKSSKAQPEPCNLCENCKAITQGSYLDVFEIDAASNRGIDEIRELKERIRLAPFAQGFKIYIIDEVHMLTTEAFNALLKTLEDPPAHAIFILATTESAKLPDTIVSRCVRIDFSKATEDELMHSLIRVCHGEKLSVAYAVLTLIASCQETIGQIGYSSLGTFKKRYRRKNSG